MLMTKGRVSPRFTFFVILALVSMTLLAACGDNTATAPAPTTAAALPTTAAAAATTAAAGATTAAGGTTAAASTLTGQIKIGAIATLTGNNSPFGIAIKNGFDLAVEEMNNNKFLGGATIQLVTLDDKGDKQEGISVMTKLLDQEKVVAVLGPTLSSTALAADPIAQQKGVPVLGTSNTANGITEMGNFVFRDSLPEASVIPGAVSGVSVKLKPKKA